MSDFGRINPAELDRHITGNYGEDQVEPEPEATQRPWKAVGREIQTDTPGQFVPYIVAQCGVYTLTRTDREGVPEANAEFIAHAANCHDELLAACKLACAVFFGPSGADPDELASGQARARHTLEAAIEKAERQ